MNRKKESFIGGAMALLASSIIVKLLGALFKIPLTNLIGDSGMGLFAFAMQFFSLLFVVAAAGLPVAEAHLVSESLALGDRARARSIVKHAILVFGALALVLSAALAGFSPLLCSLLGEQDAVWCVIAIAPAVFFVTIEAALRGWYQGTGNMVPTAVSQVAEAVGKLVIGLILAKKMLDTGYGIAGASVGAVIGVTCGELLAMSYLIWSARRGIRHVLHRQIGQASALPQLFQLMVPVTLGAAVMTVSGFLDMAVIYRRLPAAGFSAAEIVAAYGAYTGMAMTLFNLPQALSNSVSVSVLPALSAAHACRNTRQERRLVTSSMRLTLLVCVPCGVGLFVFAGPLLRALFASQPRGVQTAQPLLQLLGIAEPLVGLSAIATAVLQSFGRPDLTVYSMAIACTAKFAVSFSLAAQPEINILATPIGTLVCYSIMLVFNFISIVRLMHWRPPLFRSVLRPLAASVGMVIPAWILEQRLEQMMQLTPAVFLSIVAAIPLYLALLLIFHAINAEDIRPLPGGQYMIRIFRLKDYD
ncbi:MAG: polysaccharide biosynthesis protein [Eubacteriales bacterium]|nr:polysaccharide biosynthesis protein [Eubacteriales bacterium]